MQRVLALWAARNQEYYRDKGSLFWSFIATPLMVIILALAFSSDNQQLFKVGVVTTGNDRSELQSDEAQNTTPTVPAFSQQPAIKQVVFNNTPEDRERAFRQIRHHQLDILISPSDNHQYWVNPESAKGKVLESLLKGHTSGQSISSTNWQQQPLSGKKLRYIDWAIPGILAMNMMFSGLWGIGYVIVRYRKNGVLKRLQATPLKAWEFLLAQTLSRLSIMLAVTTIVFVACHIFIDFLMIGSYLLLFLIAVLGNMAIISISLLMASRTASEELANGLLNLISFPMLLLSELWFSLDDAPAWLQNISELLPLTHLVRAARAVMLEGAGLVDVAPQLAILAIMALLFTTAACWLFRWHDQ